ncbi:RNA-directed DNA polymerase, eukaryota, partial [Tanacetum coccineum]
LISFIHKKLGNGADTLFSEDAWRGGTAFKYLYPRVYALELSKNIDVASKMAHCNLGYSFRRDPRGGVEKAQFDSMLEKVDGTLLPDMRDIWTWSLEGSGDFSVASVRKLLDGNMLPEVASKTRWIKAMPIKVNVHAWRVKLDCLPTRINICHRGMEIKSIICPMCGEAAESSRHIFFSCRIAREILRKISRWWDVNFMELSSYEEWLDWILNIRVSVKHKQILEGVCYAMWWHIWNFRNKCIFDSESPSKAIIFEGVKYNACRTPLDSDSKLGSNGDLESGPTLYHNFAGQITYVIIGIIVGDSNDGYASMMCLCMHDPREPHFSALKRILKRSTSRYCNLLFWSSKRPK